MSEEDENSYVARMLKQCIEEKKRTVPSSASAPTIIRRVPYQLLEANDKYYKPRMVSIGPYHALRMLQDEPEEASYMKSESRFRIRAFVDEVKGLRLKKFLQRLKPGVTEETLIKTLTESELAISNCYDGLNRCSWFDRASFMEMMLLDGCFLVELLSSGGWNQDELLMAKSGSINLVDFELDLLNLENQLPFFFLESLYEMIQHDDHPTASLADYALFFFSRGALEGNRLCPIDLSSQHSSIKHLLHLVMFALFPLPSRSSPLPSFKWFMSYNIPGAPASELEAYGVKFRRLDGHFLMDIKFTNGLFEIPKLVLDESSASLLSNLLAAEMLSVEEEEHGRPRLVTSYICFMNCLIKDVNDLEVLCRAGIFECRGSDTTEMVSLFRDLSAKVFMDMSEFCYTDELRETFRYCRSVCPQLRAYLKRAYRDWDAFNGILLFILTVTQTLFAILGYSPSSSGNNKK